MKEENTRLHKQVKALEATVVSPSGGPKNSALTRLLLENCTPSDRRSRSALSRPESSEPGTSQSDRTSVSGSASDRAAESDQDTLRRALKTVTLNFQQRSGRTLPAPPRQVRLRLRRAGHSRLSGSHLSQNPFHKPATSTDFSKLKNRNPLTQNLHRADLASRAGTQAVNNRKSLAGD